MQDKRLLLPRNTKLLATSNIYHELDAASEVWHVLRATGICRDAQIIFIRRGKWWLRGLIGIAFDNDGLEAVEKMRSYLVKRPWIMEYTQRIIPVEVVTQDIDELIDFLATKSAQRILPEDTWMIRVSRHDSKISRMPIIEKIASRINFGKVNLMNPDWIINVEIIKDTFAAAVIRPYHIIRKKELKMH